MGSCILFNSFKSSEVSTEISSHADTSLHSESSQCLALAAPLRDPHCRTGCPRCNSLLQICSDSRLETQAVLGLMVRQRMPRNAQISLMVVVT